MTVTDWSYGLAVVNLGVQWLVAHHKPWGWLVGIAAQVPWTVYDIASRQYGFLLLTVVGVPIYLRGWRNFRKATHCPTAETER